MKLTWCHRLICFWLAAFVLIGSSGHIVLDHWCKMRGKSMQLLLSKKDCKKQCPDKPKLSHQHRGPVIYKTPCCKDVERFNRLAPESQFSVSKVQLHPPIVAWMDVLPSIGWLLVLLPDQVQRIDLSWTQDPPGRSVRFRLTKYCRWLI